MDISALYPSATGGSGDVLSPLAEAAAPAPAVEVTPDPSPAPAEAPTPDTPAEIIDPTEAPAEIVAPVDEAPFVEPTREKIRAAFNDARDTEPAATSATDYASFTRYPDGVTPDAAERDAALGALVKAGVGVTSAQALWTAGMQALKAPITTNQSGAMQSLGDNAQTLVADARAVVEQASKSWPGIKDFLNRTGLGNDPATIRFLAARKR